MNFCEKGEVVPDPKNIVAKTFSEMRGGGSQRLFGFFQKIIQTWARNGILEACSNPTSQVFLMPQILASSRMTPNPQ